MQPYESIWDSYAKLWEKPRIESRCRRKTVHALLLGVKDGQFVEITSASNASIGGPCSGELGKCGCIHAEVNLLLRNPHLRGILGINYSPCTNCANAIIASDRVPAVIYSVLTEHDPRGVEWLRNAGILVLTPGSFLTPNALSTLTACSVSPTIRS